MSKINFTTNLIIFVIVAFGLLLGNYSMERGRQAQIETMTAEYNRGFVEGRYQMIAELYLCNQIHIESVEENFKIMHKIQVAQGGETWMNCEE